MTATSGFTSFIAHAGGPPISAYVIPMRLSPVKFTATMAFFFFVINLSKWIPYAWLGLLDTRNMATSLVLLPIAPIGVLIGVRLARRISPVLFYRLLYTGMALTGIKMAAASGTVTASAIMGTASEPNPAPKPLLLMPSKSTAGMVTA